MKENPAKALLKDAFRSSLPKLSTKPVVHYKLKGQVISMLRNGSFESYFKYWHKSTSNQLPIIREAGAQISANGFITDTNCFMGGESGSYSATMQVFDLADYNITSEMVDAGRVTVNIYWQQSSWTGSDTARAGIMTFKSVENLVQVNYTAPSQIATSPDMWTERSHSAVIPSGASAFAIYLQFWLNAGTHLNGYIRDIRATYQIDGGEALPINVLNGDVSLGMTHWQKTTYFGSHGEVVSGARETKSDAKDGELFYSVVNGNLASVNIYQDIRLTQAYINAVDARSGLMSGSFWLANPKNSSNYASPDRGRFWIQYLDAEGKELLRQYSKTVRGLYRNHSWVELLDDNFYAPKGTRIIRFNLQHYKDNYWAIFAADDVEYNFEFLQASMINIVKDGIFEYQDQEWDVVRDEGGFFTSTEQGLPPNQGSYLFRISGDYTNPAYLTQEIDLSATGLSEEEIYNSYKTIGFISTIKTSQTYSANDPVELTMIVTREDGFVERFSAGNVGSSETVWTRKKFNLDFTELFSTASIKLQIKMSRSNTWAVAGIDDVQWNLVKLPKNEERTSKSSHYSHLESTSFISKEKPTFEALNSVSFCGVYRPRFEHLGAKAFITKAKPTVESINAVSFVAPAPASVDTLNAVSFALYTQPYFDQLNAITFAQRTQTYVDTLNAVSFAQAAQVQVDTINAITFYKPNPSHYDTINAVTFVKRIPTGE